MPYVCCVPAWAEDWPCWRGARGTGEWQSPPLPDQWPADGLPVVWRQPVGGGYSGLSVAQGRMYTMDRRTEPDESERIVAFDATTGELLWQHAYPVTYGNLDYGNGPRCTPTFADGRIYTLGAVGHVCCVDAATGRPIWSHDLVADFGAVIPEWGLAASPVVWRDQVIIHPGVKAGGCLMAFDRQTGEEVWRASDDPAGYCTPMIIDNRGRSQLLAWTPEHILGVDPTDGRPQWSVPYKVTYGVSIASPVFQQGIALVTGYWEGTKAVRLGPDPTHAELIWEDTTKLQGIMSAPLYREGHIYCLDRDRGLICAELATGRQLWNDEHKMTPRGRNPHAALVWTANEDLALILNSEGDLILARLSPEGYAEQSRTNIIQPNPKPIWAHPAFSDDRVYARNDTEVVCVQLTAVAEAGD
jgi:outer membrane protein assembly factor BamB